MQFAAASIVCSFKEFISSLEIFEVRCDRESSEAIFIGTV